MPLGTRQETKQSTRTGHRGWGVVLIARGLIAFLSLTCAAQGNGTALSGVVTDSSGRVLSDVRVLVEQSANGFRRATTTSASGSYEVPELPIGVYTVTFGHDGFQALRCDNVVQSLGQTRTLDISLRVAGSNDRIQVTANTQSLDHASNTLGIDTGRKQTQELPLNGRNWATLTALAPGAIDTGGSNQRSIRFAGRGRDDNDFTYDGVDATNVINQAQQVYVRLAVPLDSIQEFRVESALATAETGASGGGQLIISSPSGSNDWHAELYEFLRNSALDATEPIDHLNPRQPPFHLNQFGGSVSGPVVRNQTFFFVAYEGYRQSLGQTLTGFVPTNVFRAQLAKQYPALLPLINGYPQGQTPLSPAVARFVGQGRQLGEEDSGMLRLDDRFSDMTTLFVRANIDQALSEVPLASLGQYLNDRTQSTSSPVNSTVELLHVFSPRLLNEIKFGFNRSTAINTNRNQSGLVYAVSVPGFTTLGNNRLSAGFGNTFSVIDDLCLIRGRHVIKTGVQVRRVQMNQGSSASGTISFSSIDAFAANQVNTANLASALPTNGLRKTQYFGYGQDEFKWRRNLTLNLGLRYSFFNIFHEVQGRSNPFDFATCGPQGFCGVGTSFGQPNYKDLDPRIAFAWAPTIFSGKTVIRGGFGTYHEDGQLDDQNLPDSNEVYRFSLSSKTISSLQFPLDPFLADVRANISPRAQDRRRKDTYVTQWGLSVQQELPGDFLATASYLGTKGTHLLTVSEVNVVNPATGGRPYPAFGQIDWRGNENNSEYEGLSVAIRRAFSRQLLFSTNYMWSHEIDDGSDGSGDGDSLTAQNVACQACERASGAFDARHVLNANLVYELPFGRNQRYLDSPGVLRDILGSWELNAVVTARTGFPVNVTIDRSSSQIPDGNANNQRPDRVPGISLTPPGGRSTVAWINPAAFRAPAPGSFGDAPRNIARAPGAWQVDIGIAKNILVTERAGLQLRAEAFNVFNHPQYGAPQADFSAGVGIFGSILSTINSGPVGAGTPRQIQLALRLSY